MRLFAGEGPEPGEHILVEELASGPNLVGAGGGVSILLDQFKEGIGRLPGRCEASRVAQSLEPGAIRSLATGA